MKRIALIMSAVSLFFSACQPQNEIQSKVDNFIEVDLTADISHLSDKEKQMLPLLFEAAQIMDDIFWQQAYGDKHALMESIKDEATKRFLEINYGPWERLNNNEPFIRGYGSKPLGANFYPLDMSKEEFEAFDSDTKSSLYTVIGRKDDGTLESVPYSQAYNEQHEKAAELLLKAAELAEDEGLKNYLAARSQALLTDDYLASDLAWMDMKTNNIDFVIGPIENYEDRLFGYKAAHEAFILIKDLEWSSKLSRFAALLPELQNSLPVSPE